MEGCLHTMKKISASSSKRLSCFFLLILVLIQFGCRISEKPGARPPDAKQKQEPKSPPAQKPAPAPSLSPSQSLDNTAISSGLLRAQKIDNKHQLALGSWADGYLGDYVIENDKIRAIIAAPERKYEAIKGGGHLIDLCSTDYVYDYIRSLNARIGSSSIPDYSYDKIEIKTTGYPDNGAAIIVSGRSDPGKPPYTISTQYLLNPGSPMLQITTSVTNLTTQTLTGLELGDWVDWGACNTFVSNHGIIGTSKNERLNELEWFCGFYDNFSAGLTQKQGFIQGEFQEYNSFVTYQKVDIKPAESISYTRYLVVSDKNFSKISDFAYSLRQEKVGIVTGKVIEPDTRNPVKDVDIRFIINRRGGKSLPALPYTRVYSKDKGEFEVTLPEGSYFLQSKAFARRTDKNPYSFPVKDGDSYGFEVKVSPSSKLKFTCVDSDTGIKLPCKLTFVNIPPTSFLDYGPGTRLSARNVYYSATGEGTVDVPIGRYKVLFSRGIEYNTYEEDILINFTTENVINARLKHVIDLPGYISADVGVRTNKSYDCYITPEDRVVTAASEGVEYLVSGDSNTATDLAPAVEKMGLQKFLKTGIGKRIEFLGEKNLGHFMVWPLSQERAQVTAGNPELGAQTPRELIQILRSQYPDALVQVNRSLFPGEGYFSNFGYDKDKNPVIADPNFSYAFDLLEVWEGKRQGVMMDTVKLFVNTLLAGHNTIMPTAGSFSQASWGEEVGYPRIYVASKTDDPSQISESEIRESMKKGNILITNGPVIKFTVNGQPPGSFITDTDGEVECHLEVLAAPWVQISHIEVTMDGIFLKRIIQPPSKEIVRFPRSKSPKGSENFKVKIKKDSILTVEVVGSGHDSLSPIVPPHPFQGAGIKAYAITAPIIIDYDGNGKYDPPAKDQIGM